MQWPKNLFDESTDKDDNFVRALKGADSIPEPAKQTLFNITMLAFLGSFASLRHNL